MTFPHHDPGEAPGTRVLHLSSGSGDGHVVDGHVALVGNQIPNFVTGVDDEFALAGMKSGIR